MQPEWRGEEQVSCIRAQSISAMHRALPRVNQIPGKAPDH